MQLIWEARYHNFSAWLRNSRIRSSTSKTVSYPKSANCPPKVKSFLVDICDWHRSCYFRAYPDVVVHSGAEATAKIRAIERDTASYPWDKLQYAADLSGIYFDDRLFEVLSLDFPHHPDTTEYLK